MANRLLIICSLLIVLLTAMIAAKVMPASLGTSRVLTANHNKNSHFRDIHPIARTSHGKESQLYKTKLHEQKPVGSEGVRKNSFKKRIDHFDSSSAARIAKDHGHGRGSPAGDKSLRASEKAQRWLGALLTV
ncbi:uncharacterized protein LOC129591610 [Paramacrobiotus metropolitanus]|uniref:uncharacterized protein LOC129591610 n=1 Tax=Paramacrobiotus metropolitanus TaxID=2943436 RepID=UPI0024465919|nr:uncharacterized protein LOC129591610 [Paramacrobiotus metropolitanus]